MSGPEAAHIKGLEPIEPRTEGQSVAKTNKEDTDENVIPDFGVHVGCSGSGSHS